MANPIKKWGYVAQGRAAMKLLKNEILDKVLLRRTKVQCADVLALPPRYTWSQRLLGYTHIHVYTFYKEEVARCSALMS